MDIAKLFATHSRALGVAQQRLELLTGNLANADTPGYKARDLDFNAAMQAAGSDDLRLAASRPGHLAGTGAGGPAQAMYRVPEHASADGNTVDAQRESAAVAETSVRYQATLTFLNSRIQGLRNALTGGRG